MKKDAVFFEFKADTTRPRNHMNRRLFRASSPLYCIQNPAKGT